MKFLKRKYISDTKEEYDIITEKVGSRIFVDVYMQTKIRGIIIYDECILNSDQFKSRNKCELKHDIGSHLPMINVDELYGNIEKQLKLHELVTL